ncbi:MAG: 3'-5' exonuclease, partial [Sphingomonadaceae bacterium]
PAGAAASPDERLAVVTPAERIMARRLAGLMRAWLDDPAPRPSTGRRLAPGDVLILVRRRADLIAALGAALQEAGIPVAGPDRLMLTASLAVQDMLSLMRVMLQPADDLALCEVLTSPMGALDHGALLPLAAGRRPAEPVWDRLRASEDPAVQDIADWLAGLRAQVDFLPPSAWLREVLDHPRRGARAITARLGPAALDQLGELLNAAREHERRHPPGMRGFLGWLLRHDVAIKRDPDAPGAEVRLMTVHAAKGLQAPVVILADAAARPRDLRDPWLPVEADGAIIPFFHAGRPTLGEGLAQARERRIADQAQEEARLLYVAMTRAEDCLVVTGALSRKDWSKDEGRHVPHPESWWARVRAAVEAEGAQTADMAGWP